VTDQPRVTSAPPVKTAPEPVSLGRRFVALLIDWVLCLLISSIFGDPRRDSWIPLVVLVVEYAFFIGLFAQTPGMYVRSIRCVSVTTGGPIGIPRAALRGILLCLVIPAVIMDSGRRGVHDRAAGSVVVEAPRHPRPAS
jgi:uncharacterized RDD family membrane protein YckC